MVIHQAIDFRHDHRPLAGFRVDAERGDAMRANRLVGALDSRFDVLRKVIAARHDEQILEAPRNIQLPLVQEAEVHARVAPARVTAGGEQGDAPGQVHTPAVTLGKHAGEGVAGTPRLAMAGLLVDSGGCADLGIWHRWSASGFTTTSCSTRCILSCWYCWWDDGGWWSSCGW